MAGAVNWKRRWDDRFATPDYLFGTEPNTFLAANAFRIAPGGRVLAVADGEGRNGVWLAAQGLDVVAMDFSAVALAKSRALAASRGATLSTIEADIYRWEWEADTFDAVVAIFIQFAPPDRRPALFAGLKRTLRPGGVLLLQGYRPEQIAYATGGPGEAGHLYTRDLLETVFGDFSSLDIREYDTVIEEGAGHNGLSALIDLVGRK
jgi:SAM-dependent methyltransferase